MTLRFLNVSVHLMVGGSEDRRNSWTKRIWSQHSEEYGWLIKKRGRVGGIEFRKGSGRSRNWPPIDGGCSRVSLRWTRRKSKRNHDGIEKLRKYRDGIAMRARSGLEYRPASRNNAEIQEVFDKLAGIPFRNLRCRDGRKTGHGFWRASWRGIVKEEKKKKKKPRR